MFNLFTSYDFLIFVSLNYTTFHVIANLNGLVDFYRIVYPTSLNVTACICQDLVSLSNYFEIETENT